MGYFRFSDVSGSTFEGAVTSTGVLPLRRPAPIRADVGAIVAVTSTIILPSGTNFALNDVAVLAILPADHIPVDYLIDSDVFDSNAATTFAIAIGLMTGTFGDSARTQANVGAEFGTAIKTSGVAGATTRAGQTNGSGNAAFVVQNFAQTLQRIAPIATADREIGLAITAAAATNPATIRRMDFTLFYRAARYGA